jgi:hypothetical protein
MIVSHKHKFIFIKTKKTAGTSIEIALSKVCDDNDIITPINKEDEIIREQFSKRKAQNTVIPFSKYTLKDWLRFIKYRKRLEFYNHMPASEIKKYLDASIWSSYYKFCFEREPLRKSISHYKWRKKKVRYNNFEEYFQSGDMAMIKGDYFYKDVKGNYLVNKVFKMEEMDSAFKNISDEIGLKNSIQIPRIITKKTEKDPSISIEDIENEYGIFFKKYFKTEYKDLYNS